MPVRRIRGGSGRTQRTGVSREVLSLLPGLVALLGTQPSAYALGYHLPVLRTCGHGSWEGVPWTGFIPSPVAASCLRVRFLRRGNGDHAKPRRARRRRRRLLHLHPRVAYARCGCKSYPCQLLPARRAGAPGHAKDAPGEWRVEWDPHSGKSGKIRESATPAGVGDTLGTRDPGSLRTPGYLLQRLRRNPQDRSRS